MAQDLKSGDTVYVPYARLGLADPPFALYKTKVEHVAGRSVTVTIPEGRSKTIGSSLVHKNLGIAIIRIGDMASELSLLDPLAKSMLQYCRLLVDDSAVLLQEVRSLAELGKWWAGNHGAYSHVLLVGHGRKNGIQFAVDDWVDASAFAAKLKCRATERKIILSLCCQTGYASFGQALSLETMCSVFVGPFNSVHGAIGSQFCQTFLAYQLLKGETTAVAFKHARQAVPGSTSFRLWQQGRLKAQ